MDLEHFPDTLDLVPNPAWPDFCSDAGVLMDDHHLAQRLRIAPSTQSQHPAKWRFSSKAICYYKREVIICDLLAFLHFASGTGLMKLIGRAMTSGFGDQSYNPSSVTSFLLNLWSVTYPDFSSTR